MRLRKSLSKASKNIKNEWKSWYFRFYLIGILFLLFAWFFTESVSLRSVSIILFPFFQVLYVLKRNTDFFERFMIISYSVAFFFLGVAYLAIYLREPTIAIPAFILSPIVFIIAVLVPMLFSFLRSKHIPDLIISYIIVSLLIILSFGYTYAVLSSWTGNGIVWANNENGKDTYDFIYFSGQVFYSYAFESNAPLGLSRYFALAELIISTIIHVIVLGYVVKRVK